jgi:DNA-3-methyladenine glycosylase I
MKQRCPWAENDPLMMAYHDSEWGVPVHDDRTLFEFLILEGAQAGLSWTTILRKRERYRSAFYGFDPKRVAAYDDEKVELLMADPGIVRNRRKIIAAIENAQAVLRIEKEFGSFDVYLWHLVADQPIQNRWKTMGDLPASTDESIRLSKDLLRRGFRFVGPTIRYAFMQAVGMVNDHLASCYRHAELS